MSITTWLLITFEEGNSNKKWSVVSKCSGDLEKLQNNIVAELLGFGYLW
jgi:hypothetical protein